MLYELEVIQSDCERIGDPIALSLTDIINNNQNIDCLGKFYLIIIIKKNKCLEITNNNNQIMTNTLIELIRFKFKKLFKAPPLKNLFSFRKVQMS